MILLIIIKLRKLFFNDISSVEVVLSKYSKQEHLYAIINGKKYVERVMGTYLMILKLKVSVLLFSFIKL